MNKYIIISIWHKTPCLYVNVGDKKRRRVFIFSRTGLSAVLFSRAQQ